MFRFPLMHWLVNEKITDTIVVEFPRTRLLFSAGAEVLQGKF
jgi:hypothetical protein